MKQLHANTLRLIYNSPVTSEIGMHYAAGAVLPLAPSNQPKWVRWPSIVRLSGTFVPESLEEQRSILPHFHQEHEGTVQIDGLFFNKSCLLQLFVIKA